MSRSGALSSRNINGVYIPSALIAVGVTIVKKEWLPYALLLVSLIGGYKVFSNRMANFHARPHRNTPLTFLPQNPERSLSLMSSKSSSLRRRPSHHTTSPSTGSVSHEKLIFSASQSANICLLPLRPRAPKKRSYDHIRPSHRTRTKAISSS